MPTYARNAAQTTAPIPIRAQVGRGEGVTNASTAPAANTGGPTVGHAALQVSGKQMTGVVISFSSALDPARAQDIGNYRLRLLSRGGGHGAPIPLSAASYDPSSHSVTLTFASPLSTSAQFHLRITGRPSRGLTDTSGRFLDGQANDHNGTDFAATLGPAVF